jgi:ribose 5-phosphate isomerase A
MSDRDEQKRRAAARAAEEVKSGMVLGLGSGTTMHFVLGELAARIKTGLKIAGVPSSERTAAEAARLGIPCADFATHRRLDLTIDGADQIARGSLDLVKGLGGALLREKMIALASERMIVVADQSKLVEKLGSATPVPVEIVAFGWELTLDRLKAIGATPRLRQAEGKPNRHRQWQLHCRLRLHRYSRSDRARSQSTLALRCGRDGPVLRPRFDGHYRHRQWCRDSQPRNSLVRILSLRGAKRRSNPGRR